MGCWTEEHKQNQFIWDLTRCAREVQLLNICSTVSYSVYVLNVIASVFGTHLDLPIQPSAADMGGSTSRRVHHYKYASTLPRLEMGNSQAGSHQHRGLRVYQKVCPIQDKILGNYLRFLPFTTLLMGLWELCTFKWYFVTCWGQMV